MGSWRDAILKDFVPHVSKLTLVADPDALLTEEKLALALRNRGFDLIEFNDPVEFRYAYESQYRSLWDRGERTDLVVILRVHGAELEALPYDLLQAGRKLAFDLGGLFPNLSYPVIEKLDRSFLDALYDTQKKAIPDRMGDNTTKDFILRHVFGIAAELINNQVDLLRVLLRVHYNRIRIPELLSARLLQVLMLHGDFQTWPLNEIISDEEAFFAFLQERWPVFLDRLGSGEQVSEDVSEYGLKYPCPDFLPFDHQDIRVYIDNLFVEGKLTPVRKPKINFESQSWLRSGIVKTEAADDDIRLSRLLEIVEKAVPVGDTCFQDWLAFAAKWAELGALIHSGCLTCDRESFQKIGAEINQVFAGWLRSHYASLMNLPPANPVMLHHVPRRLARDLEDAADSKVALIVVDGLSLDQWVSIRQIMHEQDRSLVMRESAAFAWIPTLTSISRQSIFSGKPPLYFPTSISTTNSEANLWRQFWEGIGLSRLDIAYQRGLGDGDVRTAIEATLNPGKTRAVGLVIDKVDKIMHGMQLGVAGMHNQINQWCHKGFLTDLVGYLLDNHYQVWLTSDHGNIECQGKGRLSEGVIAETRGERVRIYPTSELRDSVAMTVPFAREWQPIGLPPGFFPLMAEESYAFVKEGEIIVGHGGVSIEEVIVPLVKFERKAR
ncbi:MAG: BREX-3 system phosphatase PglZ [Desulfuromonadaceae bacterium]|nr:BREX-3 system phosphatase PglZ [Desulfuromonadaceae bacterium]MDD2856433.1 BREX-3 system phosphatase PglZ [Desulfuromonadaceae bacterium]